MVTGRAPLVVPVVIAIVVLALIAPTLMPGVGFWDTAEFQTVAPVFGTAHPTGYPTYVILGWLASVVLQPFGEPAFRMNLFSALCVAAAAGLTVVLVRQLMASIPLAAATGLALGATPLAWRLGTHADAHTLHLLLVALLFVLLVGWERRHRSREPGADRWLVAAAALFGVSAANHSLTLLLAPVVGIYVLAVAPDLIRRPRLVAACALAVAGTTALLYLQLPLRAGAFPAPLVYGRPDTWDGFRYIVLAEQFRGLINDPFGGYGAKVASVAEIAERQLGLLAIILPVAFLATVRRQPRYSLLSGLAFLVTVLFSTSYINADIERYYLVPALIAWTWLAILVGTIGDGAARALVSTERDGEGLGARTARGLAAAVAAGILLGPTVVALPDRAEAVDRSDDRAAQRWLDSVLETAERDAIIVSWWSFSTPLWYAQHVEGRRPDIFVADDRTRLDRGMGGVIDVVEANLGRRPVYVIRLDRRELDELDRRYVLERLPAPASQVLRVVARREGTA